MRLREIPLLFCTLLLASCGSGSDDSALNARGAQSGLRVSRNLLDKALSEQKALPVPLASLQATMTLSEVEPPKELPQPTEEGRTGDAIAHDTAFLQELIGLLGTDVQALLNSSPDRAEALRQYLISLESHQTTGETRLRLLKEKENTLKDDERRLQRSVGDLRDTLDEAVRGGEGTRASSITHDLLDRETVLAHTQTDFAVASRLATSFADVLAPLRERLEAVRANRDALLKGVRVVSIPGVETLGIIEVKGGIVRLRGR